MKKLLLILLLIFPVSVFAVYDSPSFYPKYTKKKACTFQNGAYIAYIAVQRGTTVLDHKFFKIDNRLYYILHTWHNKFDLPEYSLIAYDCKMNSNITILDDASIQSINNFDNKHLLKKNGALVLEFDSNNSSPNPDYHSVDAPFLEFWLKINWSKKEVYLTKKSGVFTADYGYTIYDTGSTMENLIIHKF